MAIGWYQIKDVNNKMTEQNFLESQHRAAMSVYLHAEALASTREDGHPSSSLEHRVKPFNNPEYNATIPPVWSRDYSAQIRTESTKDILYESHVQDIKDGIQANELATKKAEIDAKKAALKNRGKKNTKTEETTH